MSISMVLGYIAVGIVAIIFIYVMGSAMIHQWKHDKTAFMISVALVVELIMTITGAILKGMGL